MVIQNSVRTLVQIESIVPYLIFFSKKVPIFLHTCTTCSELPFIISTTLLPLNEYYTIIIGGGLLVLGLLCFLVMQS